MRNIVRFYFFAYLQLLQHDKFNIALFSLILSIVRNISSVLYYTISRFYLLYLHFKTTNNPLSHWENPNISTIARNSQHSPTNMEMINIDPAQAAHHIELVLLLVHGVIVLGEREAVGDLQAVLHDQPQQGTLRHLHVALGLLMAVLHYFHNSLRKSFCFNYSYEEFAKNDKFRTT